MSKYEQWVDTLLGREELPKRTDTSLEQNIGSRPMWYPALWIGLGVLSIWLVYWVDTTGWRAVGGWVVGLMCIFLGIKSAQLQSGYHQAQALQNEDDVRFAREVYLKRMDYQPVNLSTLTTGDIERMRAEGTLHALNLAQLQNERHIQLTQDEAARVREHEAALAAAGYIHESIEAKRQREHDARERERDRQLTIDQLITKFDGQIREIETRMSLERPDAHYRSQQELIRLRARMMQLTEINKLRTTDPVLHRQLFDDWKRGYV